MNKWKATFFTVLIALLVTNIFWIIIVVDQGISYSYLKVSYDDEIKDRRVFKKFLLEDLHQYTDKNILSILRKENPKAFIVKEGNKIYIENIIFEFKNEKLISVK
ncbi:MAG TPA: hypothetical protein ENJ34_00305 [Epsilonproteobacteria bacterium]|nr:hypothetical protein [Campylobacterota bacterium]